MVDKQFSCFHKTQTQGKGELEPKTNALKILYTDKVILIRSWKVCFIEFLKYMFLIWQYRLLVAACELFWQVGSSFLTRNWTQAPKPLDH